MTYMEGGENPPIIKAHRVPEDEKVLRAREKEEDIEERKKKKEEEKEEEERRKKEEEEEERDKTHKVQKCKHIPTLSETLALKKSETRPDAQTSTNGEIGRPELGRINKSISPSPRMGRGVDPHKVVENDWNDYKLYMSRNKFY